MPKDKSLFFYGSIYNRLLDPQLAECRQKTVDLVPEAATVLDIACGTGQLCFELKIHKHCHVTGLDLSLRMLEFARKSNSFQDISFVHEDATNLNSFKDNTFDYATMLMILHELPRPQQIGMLKEALRVAKRGIIVDSVVPLPKKTGGYWHSLSRGNFRTRT